MSGNASVSAERRGSVEFQWKPPVLPEAPGRWARITDFLDEKGVHIALIGTIALSAIGCAVLFFVALKAAAFFALQLTVLLSLIQIGVAGSHNKKQEERLKEHGYTPLHIAVVEKNYVRIQRLLERDEVDLNARSRNGCNSLHLAVLEDDQIAAALLLTEDARRRALDSKKPDKPVRKSVLVNERVGVRASMNKDPVERMVGLEREVLDLQEEISRIDRFAPMHLVIAKTKSLAMLSLLVSYKADGSTLYADKNFGELLDQCVSDDPIKSEMIRILSPILPLRNDTHSGAGGGSGPRRGSLSVSRAVRPDQVSAS
jgi:hypothetical protein